MTKREVQMRTLLDSLSEDHQTVNVHLSGFRLKGSISKEKDKYHIGTSTSLFKVVPKEVIYIKNLKGKKLG